MEEETTPRENIYISLPAEPTEMEVNEDESPKTSKKVKLKRSHILRKLGNSPIPPNSSPIGTPDIFKEEVGASPRSDTSSPNVEYIEEGETSKSESPVTIKKVKINRRPPPKIIYKAAEEEKYENIETDRSKTVSKMEILETELKQDFTKNLLKKANTSSDNVIKTSTEKDENKETEKSVGELLENISSIDVKNSWDSESSSNFELKNASKIENVSNLQKENSSNIELETLSNVEIENISNLEIENLANLGIENLANLELENSFNLELENSFETENSSNLEREQSPHLEMSSSIVDIKESADDESEVSSTTKPIKLTIKSVPKEDVSNSEFDSKNTFKITNISSKTSTISNFENESHKIKITNISSNQPEIVKITQGLSSPTSRTTVKLDENEATSTTEDAKIIYETVEAKKSDLVLTIKKDPINNKSSVCETIPKLIIKPLKKEENEISEEGENIEEIEKVPKLKIKQIAKKDDTELVVESILKKDEEESEGIPKLIIKPMKKEETKLGKGGHVSTDINDTKETSEIIPKLIIKPIKKDEEFQDSEIKNIPKLIIKPVKPEEEDQSIPKLKIKTLLGQSNEEKVEPESFKLKIKFSENSGECIQEETVPKLIIKTSNLDENLETLPKLKIKPIIEEKESKLKNLLESTDDSKASEELPKLKLKIKNIADNDEDENSMKIKIKPIIEEVPKIKLKTLFDKELEKQNLIEPLNIEIDSPEVDDKVFAKVLKSSKKDSPKILIKGVNDEQNLSPARNLRSNSPFKKQNSPNILRSKLHNPAVMEITPKITSQGKCSPKLLIKFSKEETSKESITEDEIKTSEQKIRGKMPGLLEISDKFKTKQENLLIEKLMSKKLEEVGKTKVSETKSLNVFEPSEKHSIKTLDKTESKKVFDSKTKKTNLYELSEKQFNKTNIFDLNTSETRKLDTKDDSFSLVEKLSEKYNVKLDLDLMPKSDSNNSSEINKPKSTMLSEKFSSYCDLILKSKDDSNEPEIINLDSDEEDNVQKMENPKDPENDDKKRTVLTYENIDQYITEKKPTTSKKENELTKKSRNFGTSIKELSKSDDLSFIGEHFGGAITIERVAKPQQKSEQTVEEKDSETNAFKTTLNKNLESTNDSIQSDDVKTVNVTSPKPDNLSVDEIKTPLEENVTSKTLEPTQMKLDPIKETSNTPVISTPIIRKRGRPRKVPLEVREDLEDEVNVQDTDSTQSENKEANSQVNFTCADIKANEQLQSNVVILLEKNLPTVRGFGRGRRGGYRGKGRRGGKGGMLRKSILNKNNLKKKEKESANLCIEEDTRMSADQTEQKDWSAAQKRVLELSAAGEESLSSNCTNESSTLTGMENIRPRLKRARLEIMEKENRVVTGPESIAEYIWNNNGPFMIQEQVTQYLGVKSFKRKYPGLTRHSVEMQERDYLREKGYVSEAMCDMGLTAVPSSEILDIMFTDFQEKYEEYQKFQREKHAKEITNKQKAFLLSYDKKLGGGSIPGNISVSMLDNSGQINKTVIHSAANWNLRFNRSRQEQRKCCMDLQTHTIMYPKKVKYPRKPSKITETDPGYYPVALLPGQFTDWFKHYTPDELKYLPVNTILYGPIAPNKFENVKYDASDSGSDSDSSDSDSDSNEDGTSASESGSESSESDVEMGAEESNNVPLGDICKMCSSNPNKNKQSKPELLLQCHKCNCKYHPSCIDLTKDMIKYIKEYNWSCTDCKKCSKCEQAIDEDKMVFCDRCDRSFHFYCVGKKTMPIRKWHCTMCMVNN